MQLVDNRLTLKHLLSVIRSNPTKTLSSNSSGKANSQLTPFLSGFSYAGGTLPEGGKYDAAGGTGEEVVDDDAEEVDGVGEKDALRIRRRSNIDIVLVMY